MSQPHVSFIGYSDLVGLTRGRSVPASGRDSALSGGVGWTPGNLALTAFGSIAPGNLFGARGDVRLVPDAATSAVIPADGSTPETEILLGDFVHLDGRPWECCPRSALRDALSDLEEHAGLRVVASFEHEFMIDPTPESPAFSLTRLRSAEPFGSDLVALLTAVGLEPETWMSEYAEDQFEITVAPSDALTAADRAILLKELVRDLAGRRGLRTTFAPVVNHDGPGNGVHIHLSLVDKDGVPALYDAAAPGRLSDVGARFSAGILTHAHAILGWTAPSPVSFFRLAPNKWSVGGVFLADQSREALLRICPTSSLSKTPVERQFNLEFRAVDATANPWMALAAIVRAGLQGLQDGYRPAEVRSESTKDSDVPRLPSSTEDALDALESDKVAAGWFPADLLATHLAVRRDDLSTLKGLDDDTLCSRVADVY